MADTSSPQGTDPHEDSTTGAASETPTNPPEGTEEGGKAGQESQDYKEATNKIREQGEELKAEREKREGLESEVKELREHLGLDRKKEEEEEGDPLDPRLATKDDVFELAFKQDIAKHPKLAEHSDEVKAYMKDNNLPFEKAAKLVYDDHDMLNDEAVLNALKLQATPGLSPSPSGRESTGDTRTPEQAAQDKAEGITDKDHQEFDDKVAEVWRKREAGV